MNLVLFFLALGWTEPTTVTIDSGYATYYSPGLMLIAAKNQGIEIPEGTIPVALNRKGDKNREVWIAWPSGNIDRGWSVDCAAPGDYQARLDRDTIIEVQAEIAKREGFYGVGPYPVIISFVQPPVRAYKMYAQIKETKNGKLQYLPTSNYIRPTHRESRSMHSVRPQLDRYHPRRRPVRTIIGRGCVRQQPY